MVNIKFCNFSIYLFIQKLDQIEGKGIMKYFNGDTLEGEWKGGIPSKKTTIEINFLIYFSFASFRWKRENNYKIL